MQHYLKENRRILLIILLTIQDIQAQDPCLDGNHGVPSSLEKRSPLYVMDSTPICDRYIVESWYGARGYNISLSPPSLTYCGTLYPVWLNDQPPSEGQTELLSVCQVGFRANCDRSYNIEVKNCGEFLVYKLKPVDLCNSAYCFETPTVITSSVAITTFNAAASVSHIDIFNDHSGDMKLEMTRALDGDNMTCFQLPLQDEQTPFFLVRISVIETFGIKAIPYDITITGNGLSCDRQSIERMSQARFYA
ncbi:oncoprotein-induced transcript 3 protein-like [Saccostrea cucullata]|uniref:oncoprotein-induced transcript 3 protein-like n=1 Tax=Saccostrea cuccullata TaxID=36930 RepID=UPI002ED017C9